MSKRICRDLAVFRFRGCSANRMRRHRARTDAPRSRLGEDRVNFVGHGFEQAFQKLPSCAPVGLVDELRDRELAGAVDSHEEMELDFSSLKLGDVDVK